DIHGFDAQPIRHKDEVLGVLGLFTRIPIPEQGPAWLRIFADYIAVAFVNARAFEENDRLRARLELETAYLREEVREAKALGDIIGQSAAITDLQRQIDIVAPTHGTLLLDEVGEIPPELQSKLLRVLQEKQYERVGEETTRTINVRIVAASNRDLKAEVAAGRFRQDLYYRLNVFAIEVAPLREHKD